MTEETRPIRDAEGKNTEPPPGWSVTIEGIYIMWWKVGPATERPVWDFWPLKAPICVRRNAADQALEEHLPATNWVDDWHFDDTHNRPYLRIVTRRGVTADQSDQLVCLVFQWLAWHVHVPILGAPIRG
jgi:hypothetical protein